MRICFLVTWLFVLTLCMLSLCCNVFVFLIATTHAIRTKHASTWKETSNQLTAHKTANTCIGMKLNPAVVVSSYMGQIMSLSHRYWIEKLRMKSTVYTLVNVTTVLKYKTLNIQRTVRLHLVGDRFDYIWLRLYNKIHSALYSCCL